MPSYAAQCYEKGYCHILYNSQYLLPMTWLYFIPSPRRLDSWDVDFGEASGSKIYIGSGAQPISYSTGTEGSFAGVKRPGREDNRSPLSVV
jgi:hypothetical protein